MDHPWLDPEAARSALGFPLVELPPAPTTSAPFSSWWRRPGPLESLFVKHKNEKGLQRLLDTNGRSGSIGRARGRRECAPSAIR